LKNLFVELCREIIRQKSTLNGPVSAFVLDLVDEQILALMENPVAI